MPPPAQPKSVWETLSVIDVNDHVEKKGQFSYLSWPWAWSTLKNKYPNATYRYHTNPDTHLPFFTDPKNENAYVCVTVEAGGEVATETMPVLNHQNKSIVTPSSFEVNVSLKRCMVKAIAVLGLGHYIYAGEDLPQGPKSAIVDGVEVTGADAIREAILLLIPTLNTAQKLDEFGKSHKPALSVLESQAATDYSRVIAALKMKRKEIMNAQE